MLRKKKYQSPRFAERQKRVRIFNYVAYSILVIVSIVLMVVASRHASMQINEVVIKKAAYVEEEKIQEYVEEKIDGNYLFLFSKSNRFLYPKGRIMKTITESYAAVERVDLRFSDHVLTVELIERSPYGLLCHTERCYLLDADGFVFAPEPLLHKGEYIRFLEADRPDVIGSYYVDTEAFINLNTIAEALKVFDIVVEEVRLDSQTIYMYSEEGMEIRMRRDQGVSKIINNLGTLIEQETITQDQFAAIEYIDVRFGDKVFYRLRNESNIDEEDEEKVNEE